MAHLTNKEKMQVRREVSRFVRAYESEEGRGATAMAKAQGRSIKLVANETNPNYEGAKYAIEEAIDAELIADIYPLLHMHARVTGHVCFRMPKPDKPLGDLDLINAITQFQADNGRTCETIKNALDPNGPGGTAIMPDEVIAIAEAGYEQASTLMALIEQFKLLQEPERQH